MSNGCKEELLPEVYQPYPILPQDQKDHDRTTALVTTTRNAAALAREWIIHDPNGTSFEATTSIIIKDGWFKSRSITTKISVRKY